MPGICTSISTRSGAVGAGVPLASVPVASATACVPPLACNTTSPTACSSAAATSRLMGLSSTTSTRAPRACRRSATSGALGGMSSAGSGAPWRCTVRIKVSCSDDALIGLTSTALKPTASAAWRMPGSS